MSQAIEVVVPDAQLSLAIGRKGQNVRLASQLTGWDIDIMTEASESERRQAEFAERSSTFMEALDVDEVVHARQHRAHRHRQQLGQVVAFVPRAARVGNRDEHLRQRHDVSCLHGEPKKVGNYTIYDNVNRGLARS